MFGEDFASVEYAYFWHMAKEFCKDDLAKEIKNSKHAGQAKRLSKQIADDEGRWEWERDHINVMKTLLAAKADQCIQFHDCLIENKEKLLAEANPGTFWASGLSLYVTEHCSPQFWPGQDMLGVLLTELTQTLLMKEEDVSNVIENSESSGDEDEVTENEENDKDTGDSEEMHNKMEDNKMEVASQETTESQETAINQELRESQKSAVSHVPVLSEETASTQNNDNKVKVSHYDDRDSHPHTYRPSTAQHLCNIQSLSAAKHSQGTRKKDITMKDGKKKKEQTLTSQQTSQSVRQPGNQPASQSNSQSASKPDSQLASQSRHSSNQSSSSLTIQLASQSINQSLSAGSNEQSTGESPGDSTEVSPARYGEVSTGGSTGGLSVSRSRQKQRTPPAFRGPRSYSTPRRTKAMTDSAHDIGY